MGKNKCVNNTPKNLKEHISKWIIEESKHTYKYYRTTLSDDEKRCYDAYINAFFTFQGKVRIPIRDAYKCEHVYQLCILDNPLLFYVENVYIWKKAGEIEAEIEYYSDESGLFQIWKEIDRIIKLVRGECAEKSDIKREEMIHNTMVSSVDYKNSESIPVHSSYSAFMYHKAVCDGISKMTKILFDAVDIPSLIVYGKSWRNIYKDGTRAEEGNHAWNMVKIGNDFYHIDVTFDLNLTKKKVIRYDYFNLTDEQISRDHSYNLLPETPIKENDFFRCKGRFFANKKKLKEYILEEINSGNKNIGFKLPYTKDPDETYKSISELIKTSIKQSQIIASKYYISFNPEQMVIYLELH